MAKVKMPTSGKEKRVERIEPVEVIIPDIQPDAPSYEPVKLVVANCASLNVRENSSMRNSKILCKIPAGTEILIDELTDSNDGWVHISDYVDNKKNYLRGYVLLRYTSEA